MKAGDLTSSVVVYKKVIVTSDFGADEENYAIRGSYRCQAKKNNSPREVAGAIIYPSEVTFTFRSRTPITETDKIEYKGKAYRVLSINTDRDSITVVSDLY